jgi:squamous cell carcinoma antigen recognized by T-cells 3
MPLDEDSVSALIEFDSREDAIAAQTRDRRVIDEHTIEIQIGIDTTIYVTNFPPTADEAYIRDLFHEVCRPSI